MESALNHSNHLEDFRGWLVSADKVDLELLAGYTKNESLAAVKMIDKWYYNHRRLVEALATRSPKVC